MQILPKSLIVLRLPTETLSIIGIDYSAAAVCSFARAVTMDIHHQQPAFAFDSKAFIRSSHSISGAIDVHCW